MSTGKCENMDCNADIIQKCHIGKDSLEECIHWKAVVKSDKTPKRKSGDKKLEVPWKGEDFKIIDIERISRRSNPLIIGIAGHADSGKTSFLGALFTLLVNGHSLREYKFCGSETLLRWESLMRKLRFDKGKVVFPPPTPSSGDYYSFLHLVLRNNRGYMKDTLFADLSGEVFTQWAVDKNDPGVDNVRWLTRFANGFIFFVNAKIIAERRMAGVHDILDLAERLKEELNGRPAIAVWSKADEIDIVNPNHVQKVEQELKSLFDQKEIYRISNYLDINANPDPKSLNNLHLLDELMNKLSCISLPKITIPDISGNTDLFLTYRGHGN